MQPEVRPVCPDCRYEYLQVYLPVLLVRLKTGAFQSPHSFWALSKTSNNGFSSALSMSSVVRGELSVTVSRVPTAFAIFSAPPSDFPPTFLVFGSSPSTFRNTFGSHREVLLCLRSSTIVPIFYIHIKGLSSRHSGELAPERWFALLLPSPPSVSPKTYSGYSSAHRNILLSPGRIISCFCS